MSTNDNTKTAAYENYPNNPLTQSGLSQTGVIAGTTPARIIETMWADKLIVDANLTGDAAGDLAVAVWPCANDGTPLNAPLAAVSSSGPTLIVGKVYFVGEYDVSAQDRVQVRCTNNDAAAQNLVCTCKVI